MRLIDADALGNRMYHESFEKDSDLQRWDGGCWIRYKLFEQVLRVAPTIDPTHPTPSNTLGALDCVDRNEAIKNLEQYKDLFSRDDGDRERYVLTRVIKELKAMPSVQLEDCDTCKHGYFGDSHCELCRVRFPSHYER